MKAVNAARFTTKWTHIIHIPVADLKTTLGKISPAFCNLTQLLPLTPDQHRHLFEYATGFDGNTPIITHDRHGLSCFNFTNSNNNNCCLNDLGAQPQARSGLMLKSENTSAGGHPAQTTLTGTLMRSWPSWRDAKQLRYHKPPGYPRRISSRLPADSRQAPTWEGRHSCSQRLMGGRPSHGRTSR